MVAEPAAPWDLAPGDIISRKALHDRFGGSRQGGIAPSNRSPNVLIFSHAASGEQHGYFDTWKGDGCFHYTGEGQRGDQELKSGNAAIAHHVDDGRTLRLFDGARGTVTYLGEAKLAPGLPWYRSDAPETGGGPTREVLVFRLQLVDATPHAATPSAAVGPPPATTVVAVIPVEEQHTERAVYQPSAEPIEADRREQRLVHALQEHLEARGHTVCRFKIQPAGEARPLYCDLVDQTTNTLIEAKGSGRRESIRMAIGQLADYARYLSPPPRRAVLVPNEPRPDLLALLDAEGVAAIWPAERGFQDSTGGKIIDG